MKYISLSDHLKNKYGTKVYKISLQSGCSCPNRDGTVSTGGCTFCSEGGSGDFAAPLLPVKEQIRLAKMRVESKMPKSLEAKDRKYIAYFQSFSNTYGDPEKLRKLYLEAIEDESIVGLSIGTRPDCLGKEILDMLQEINNIKPVWIELGLQTINEKTAEHINRGYRLEVFEKAYRDLKKRNIEVIVHVILGLPGEEKEDMLNTVRYLANLTPALDGIKLQLLHVLKNTKLAEEYEKEHFKILTMEEYTDLVVDCLKILPKNTVIHRMTGDGPRKLLIEPLWSLDKKRVLNTLHKKISCEDM
ncbi:MAG: TIGR01212 family radical SAM protein [Lachnospiraceae bacterium]|nr:TIGR01212 family radical SAM protein [Lachnospiraceae bacterium]